MKKLLSNKWYVTAVSYTHLDVYKRQLEAAPFGLALNSQFLRPTVNGLIAFSLRLLDKLQ